MTKEPGGDRIKEKHKVEDLTAVVMYDSTGGWRWD